LIGIRDHRLEVGAPANLVVFEMPAAANQGPLRILQTLVA
jgi:hypothetical protein